jgi:archaellum biogenesis ATPase FlaH
MLLATLRILENNVSSILTSLGLPISAQELFNLLVINPLQEIYEKGYLQPTIILVDSLDEALLHSGILDIVDLLSKLDELPNQVRFIRIITTNQREFDPVSGLQTETWRQS